MIVVYAGVAISLGAMLLFLKLSKSREGLLKATVLSLAGAILAFGICSPALFLQMAGAFVASIICLPFQLKRPIVVALMIIPPLAVNGLFLWSSFARITELNGLRQEFPLESLASRLAYEHRSAPLVAEPPTPRLSDAAESGLAQFEQRNTPNMRRYMLESLHERTQDEFVIAQGFGPVRMDAVPREYVALPDTAPIAVEAGSPTLGSTQSDPGATESLGSPSRMSAPSKETLAPLHFAGLEDLFNQDRMGYVREIDHVAGFQSHRFTKAPGTAIEPWRRSWKINRLELIGLLRYDAPKAYMSDNLPRFDELANASARDLDDFEAAAIERLRTEENIVIDETPDRVRMVGSIRAATDCLKCHEVRRGELLGALTYELVPIRPSVVY